MGRTFPVKSFLMTSHVKIQYQLTLERAAYDQETEKTTTQNSSQIVYSEEEIANMVGDSIIESLYQLIEIDDSELRGKISVKDDNETPKTREQKSITVLKDWGIEEPEPLQILQQEVIRNKKRVTSNWVQQNLIKLGKVLGADFQGHEEKALELLLQVDSSRQARRMETEVVSKKTRLRGAQELKSLVSFDVKFKNSGNRGQGRKLLIVIDEI